ncbi:nucleotidyltransferase family protein [Flavicella sediminum]|uniref:nucleotidyltransferase family protein n=1 Tax=Flavicella sediminum TaxID=2585141 RepID=UPI00111DEB1E|nr:nucleotidyltransferase family protein [Flavicella sediminum]
MKNKTAILILAAGGSRRMKRPKQLLAWKATTLLGNAIEQATGTGDNDVFVVLGANYEKIKESIAKYPITPLFHENWNLGIGSSLSFGIKELEKYKNYTHVLILLADQPFVLTSYLNELLQSAEQNKSKIISSLYTTKFGVPAVIPKAYFEDLKKLSGDRGAKKILEKYASESISVSNNLILSDVDSIEDYLASLRKLTLQVDSKNK